MAGTASAPGRATPQCGTRTSSDAQGPRQQNLSRAEDVASTAYGIYGSDCLMDGI